MHDACARPYESINFKNRHPGNFSVFQGSFFVFTNFNHSTCSYKLIYINIRVVWTHAVILHHVLLNLSQNITIFRQFEVGEISDSMTIWEILTSKNPQKGHFLDFLGFLPTLTTLTGHISSYIKIFILQTHAVILHHVLLNLCQKITIFRQIEVGEI